MAKPKTAEPKIRYVDIPEFPETFADTVETFVFDGVTFRCVFSVTRLDRPKPPSPASGGQAPVGAIAMPPGQVPVCSIPSWPPLQRRTRDLRSGHGYA